MTKQKICIFIDGEYFHGKNWNTGGKEKALTEANAGYWVPKIERNMRRDREVDAELSLKGWIVLHFWSREVLNNLEACLKYVDEAILEEKQL